MEGMKPDENIRRPMQWSANPNGGFTSGRPWRQPDPKFATVNVAAESSDPNSLLNHYRQLIQIRNSHPALRGGDLEIVKTKNAAIYSILRTTDNDSVLVIINTSDKPVSDYALLLDNSKLQEGNYHITALIGSANTTAINVNSSGGFAEFKPVDELQPYETIILQLTK